ncbi:MAG: CoA transferase [Gammaproteobacteria bacterium]|nr:CoA transferase [Gammaproteobacteria bacterium]MDX2460848.1 CoA transferase [Gammaproteobacteria bacterium]
MGPLAGIKVIEFAHIMAGPVCGLMLADMGADVIKVERTPDGEDTRRTLPPDIGGESASYLMMNRNKRGIVLDLKSEAGKGIARRLLEDADVAVENYRKGTMDRLALGYDDVSSFNPGIIYAELSGFGRTGPYADRAGFDLIAQGMSGIMSITGAGEGGPPTKCGPPLSDITAGILAAMGVLGAYIHRQKTGQGQRVDTSLFEAAITHTYWQSAMTFATGISPGPLGSAHPLSAPYQAFEAADGWITIGAANQTNWLRLLEVLERPDLQEDARFADDPGRMANLDDLVKILAEIFAGRSAGEWLRRLERAGVPAGPVLDIAGMQADPQALARGMVTEAPHGRLGPVKTLGHPVHYSATPAQISRGAPSLGEHTREVLGQHGYSPADVEQFVAEGVVVAENP